MIVQLIIVISTALFTLSASAGFARPLLFARLNTTHHMQKPPTTSARSQGSATTTYQRRAYAKMTDEQYQRIEKQLQQPVTTSELESSLNTNSPDHEDLDKLLIHNKSVIAYFIKNQEEIHKSIEVTKTLQIASGHLLVWGIYIMAGSSILDDVCNPIDLTNNITLGTSILPDCLAIGGALSTGISVPFFGISFLTYTIKILRHPTTQEEKELFNVMQKNGKLLEQLISVKSNK